MMTGFSLRYLMFEVGTLIDLPLTGANKILELRGFFFFFSENISVTVCTRGIIFNIRHFF